MPKIAVVTDFDGTLMEQDVGDMLMEELGVLNEKQVIEASRLFREKKVGSLAWIEAAYPLLAGQQEQVDRLIESVNLRDGARDFIDFCQQKDVPVTVLSDGMLYYIEQILSRQQMKVNRIIGNPIQYSTDGEFQFGVQNTNAACKWCGCCKASVVKQLKEDGWLVIYIGDGSSDYYGSGFADWIFARGSLARYLTEEGTNFYPFETFHDILSILRLTWPSYLNGTANRRLRGRFPASCKFLELEDKTS
ncbi:Haloacid Dehalogenase superfamily, subfamily IB, phosphoserine phosphatase-like/2,3-diketo-5-methylthio-1-phosphopentane phosphatase [Paenibacillus sp. yr247]|uniref:MtnX-like HAD-IB family phosphatase n=1 Tax=Paenibacillus sp. yr247 TaxID=1761880 RepID=UPI000883F174|nr:MtnX-like HAD-IB family phosphatase [Paenibacillus sp. yr247]SDO81602.1 Haloacid Dehalogenase superfamily, subfamily IB, phosphoserine phosphatase-like/2,3-diketo-5-methylthio-1-phosphopentane phosphatase [Paenibacillus sp. yr247]